MKRFVSTLLVGVMVFSSVSFAGVGKSHEEVIFEGRLNDYQIAEKMILADVPKEVMGDILENTSSNAKVCVKKVYIPQMELKSFSSRSSVKYENYSSTISNDQIDAVIKGKKATAVSEILVTCAGSVVESIGLFASGFTVLEKLQDIFGEDTVYASSGDRFVIDGDIDEREDLYTYCDLNDGSGMRLGLISQNLNDLNLLVEAKYYNRDESKYEVLPILDLSNEDYTSDHFDNPYNEAKRNAQLNQVEDERFVIKAGRVSIEIK